MPTVGDVKTGLQAADHDGWIRLNGRLKSTLNSSQQTQAGVLGFGLNIPDATGTVPLVSGSPGVVIGDNSRTLGRSDLPDVTLNGTTTPAGAHTHAALFNVISYAGGANDAPVLGMQTSAGYNTGGVSDHSHTLTTESINGGVTQTSIDITPKHFGVNMFVYLGA